MCEEWDSINVCSGGDIDVASVHVFLGTTYDLYLAQHGRDSYDDAGATLHAHVHFGANYDGAFWDATNQLMRFGDHRNYAGCEDVVGHEFTHAVTQATSRLFNYGQSGAISESLSDLWGEAIDQLNTSVVVPDNDSAGVRWHLGEAVGLVPVRRMDDPTAQMPPAPDRMSSPHYRCVPAEIHHNAGVNNKHAYLLVDGGTFNGQTVTGLGFPRVLDLYYEVQTNMLTSAADHTDLCLALHQACIVLGYAPTICQSVRAALDATEMCFVPRACEPPSAPPCDAGSAPADAFFDDFEGPPTAWDTVSSPWIIPQHTSPSAIGPYAVSGSGSAWSQTASGPHDHRLELLGPVTVPPGAFMHFAHARGFWSSGNQGALLEYLPAGAAGWLDAGPLFSHGGYDGALAASWVNPLTWTPVGPIARPAFVASTVGYGSSRLDLAPLAGLDVRFRFRMGGALPNVEGWYVDDVRIYTCTAIAGACVSRATVTSASSGPWSSPATWTGGVVPGPSDIVHVQPGHQVVAPPTPITIRGLCNQGFLRGDPAAPLYLEATELIVNEAMIYAADGDDGFGPTPAAWTPATAGQPMRLQTRTFHATVASDIQAGRGGHADTSPFFTEQTLDVSGGRGGDLEIHADHLFNAGWIGPSPTPLTGPPAPASGAHGGWAIHLDGLQKNFGAAYGGAGGRTLVVATQVVENAPTGRICSGQGGGARARPGEVAVAGVGGALVFSAPSVINAGTLCAGGNGLAYLDPSLALVGPSARIEQARDLVIAGGDGWTLTLADLAPGAIAVDGDITIALGAGSVVDLGAPSEPTLLAGGTVTIAAAQVVAPAGVEAAVQGARVAIEGPRVARHLVLTGPPRVPAAPALPVTIPVTLINNSPAFDVVQIQAAGLAPGSVDHDPVVLVGAIGRTRVDLVATPPPDWTGGTTLTVTARSWSDPAVTATLELTLGW